MKSELHEMKEPSDVQKETEDCIGNKQEDEVNSQTDTTATEKSKCDESVTNKVTQRHEQRHKYDNLITNNLDRNSKAETTPPTSKTTTTTPNTTKATTTTSHSFSSTSQSSSCLPYIATKTCFNRIIRIP